MVKKAGYAIALPAMILQLLGIYTFFTAEYVSEEQAGIGLWVLGLIIGIPSVVLLNVGRAEEKKERQRLATKRPTALPGVGVGPHPLSDTSVRAAQNGQRARFADPHQTEPVTSVRAAQNGQRARFADPRQTEPVQPPPFVKRDASDASSIDPPPPVAPAGWYPDPYGRFEKRFWNGAAWTNSVLVNGQSVLEGELP